MLGGGDRTSLAGARGLEPECRNQKNRSHVDRSLFAIQPAVNDFNFQAAATYLAHGPSAASEERSYGSFSRAIPCRSIQIQRKSRRSLIRAYCESNCQSRRRWRRSSKRSRSRKPEVRQHPAACSIDWSKPWCFGDDMRTAPPPPKSEIGSGAPRRRPSPWVAEMGSNDQCEHQTLH